MNVPVPGFDPSTQTWQITPASPLPAITHAVAIDGYTQASVPIAYRYPDQVSSAVQQIDSRRSAPGRVVCNLTTRHRYPRHNAANPVHGHRLDVRGALIAIVGTGNVVVTESVRVSSASRFRDRRGEGNTGHPVVTNDLTGGFNPTCHDPDNDCRRRCLSATQPYSSSVPNAVAATSGDDAQVRVIINGNQTSGATGVV